MRTTTSGIPALVLLGAAALTACGIGVDTLEEFRGSVRSGATCQELHDQRDRFSDPGTITKIDAELAAVGCDEPTSDRTDIDGGGS